MNLKERIGRTETPAEAIVPTIGFLRDLNSSKPVQRLPSIDVVDEKCAKAGLGSTP